MSIIHDALKKAQDERKSEKQDIPYNPPGTEKRPKTLVYVVIGLCVVAVVIVCLYLPYFQKPKQTMRPVGIPMSVASKPLQPDTHVLPDKTMQKPAIPDVNPAVSFPVKENSVKGMVSSSKEGMHEKSMDAPRISAKKMSSNTERKPSLSPATKKGKGDLQDISGEPEKIVIRKAEDFNVNRMYNEALRELRSGKVREAKNIYKQILAMRPNHAEALNNLGVIAMEEDNRAEALFYFKSILEYQKNYPKAYNNIGLIAMKDGDGKLAEEYFRKAISIEPDGVEPYLNLAALLRSGGRFREAAKLLDIPIQKKIKDPSLFLSYAVIKDNLGEYEEASRYYRQYLSSVHAPGSRKDIIERLKYIEEKR